jgi:hypothetical protein
MLPVRRIEVARRLVCEHDRWPQHERTRQRHALLFPTRQLNGVMIEPLTQAYRSEELPRTVDPLAPAPGLCVQLIRKQNVLERRKRGDELIALEDKPDRPPAKLRQFILRQITDGPALPSHISGARIVQPRKQTEKCRFA